MKSRTVRIALLVAIGLVALASACGVENSVVDGRCREGFTEIDARCVAIDVPAPTPSSSSPIADGAASGTDARDPFVPFPEDGSAPISDGSSGDAIAVDAPPPCLAPNFICAGACISGASDPRNCGACGKTCPSNICVAGECQGATPGDVVAIGHDYGSSFSGSAQVKVLLNAVGIPTSNPIRVLAFEGDASPQTAAYTRQLIKSGIQGRTINFTPTTSATALASPELARDYDVVLLHGAGPNGNALGSSWAAAFDAFTKKGGVLVALDDGSSTMPDVLDASGMLSVNGHAALGPNTHVVVSAPSDVVGVQVVSPYAPAGAAVRFTNLQQGPDVTIVVRTQTNGNNGAPVVVHRVAR